MSIPSPPAPLEDICSVVFNNTLYTYSANAFQALPLTKGAKWKKLPQGEKVQGGACVGSTPGDPSVAGFYVVGGKGTQKYQGLQKYTYATGQWEALTPDTPVTQDRQWHGAVFLNSSNSILVYAGAQDGSQHASTQTFTVGATAPYAVSSFQADSVPPATNPLLLPWSDTQAAFVGGDPANAKVMLFDSAGSWSDSGATLAQPLPKDAKAALVTGDDGSKNLYVFDLTDPAHAVKRVVLVDGTGAPVANAGPAKKERKRRRALTVNDWPKYDAKFAPTAPQSNYALAQDTNGMVVIAGGGKEPLSVFDGKQNRWDDATAMLVDKSSPSPSTTTKPTAKPTATSSSSSSSSSVASTSATQSSSAAPPASGSSLGTNAVLGISLGSIFGLALLLVVLYFCLERRRKQKVHLEAGHARRDSGASSTEKDGVGFASDSLPQPPPPGAGVFRGHNSHDSQGSFSSMAILMGRMKQNNSDEQQKRGSVGSALGKALRGNISKPMAARESTHSAWPRPDDKAVSFAPDTAGEPRPRPQNSALDPKDSTRRSSGWNRYWSGGSALNILGFGGSNAANNKRLTVESHRTSDYSDRSQYRITQDSATVPHLHVDVDEPRASFSRVNSGSPTISHHDSKLKEGLVAPIERPTSTTSDASAYSSGVPASVHDAWDPTQMSKPWGSDDRDSRGPGSYGTPLAPATSSKPSSSSGAPTGVSRLPQLATASTSSDMSWLNLGDHGRTSRA